MTPRGNPKRPSSKSALGGKHITAVVAAAVLAVLLVGWAGYGLHAALHPAKSVTVDRVFTGTVTIVGNNGESGCVQPDSGGRAVCSDLYPVGGRAVRRGVKVHAAHEWVTVSGGRHDLLLVYSS